MLLRGVKLPQSRNTAVYMWNGSKYLGCDESKPNGPSTGPFIIVMGNMQFCKGLIYVTILNASLCDQLTLMNSITLEKKKEKKANDFD